MVEDTMGKHNSYWTPYIGALFLSSIFGSYIGMTGIFLLFHSGSFHHRYLGLNDKRDLLGCSIKANGVLGWLKGFTNRLSL